jgi:hypothetical protein
MIDFRAIILQFEKQGEKTGWSYIEVPADLAQQIKPGNKKSFRVRGMLDGLAVSGLALMPMGQGNFIMALKADIRKKLRKSAGALLQAKLEEDIDFKMDMPDDLREFFEFEPEALEYFNSLAGSHRLYFLKWINDAKTAETRSKRVVNTANAMLRKWDYMRMIREMRKD